MGTLSKTHMYIEIDSDLIIRLQGGDGAAFRTIYDQMHVRICQVLFSLVKDREQTGELMQETFISLWLHREKLNPFQSLYPYVYLTARRLAIDHLRKKMTEINAQAYLLKHLEKDTNNTEESIYTADLHEFVEKLVSKLPKQQQRVYLLSRKSGLSCTEIAEQMHLSRNTVKNHLIGALKTLKRHVVHHGIAYLYFTLLASSTLYR